MVYNIFFAVIFHWLALYGMNRDCLSKTECNYEVLDNKSLSITYWCCCRGDNCNDPRLIPLNVIGYSTISLTSPPMTVVLNTTNSECDVYSNELTGDM